MENIENDFKKVDNGDIVATRYKYIFIIWQMGDCFCGVCKNRKTNKEKFRFSVKTLSEAKMLCKTHSYWNK